MTGVTFDPHARADVVIVGAGFGGLACAAALGRSSARVVVVDRRNHNLFQPLLYQVATAALSPADIAEPIRRSLGRYRNIRVVMAEADGVDADAQRLHFADGSSLGYRYLVIATGSEYDYFGHDDWRRHAPGLKTIHEARLIRHRLLSAFERAEREADAGQRKALLTFVVIGGGPTGVEMAGAISELGRFMIDRDFRTIARDEFDVVLLEAGPRLLAAFPDKLARYAADHLAKIGVQVVTGRKVIAVEEGRVVLEDRTISASCIVWGAGVKATPVARWLGIEAGRQGRLPVLSDLSVPGHPEIFALGDVALLDGADGKPLPALAQVAKQQGTYLGRSLRRRLAGKPPTGPFRFHNRGNTAVIGRNAAVFDFGRFTLRGRIAWLFWAVIHVYLLINFEKRILVSVQWIARYLTRQRGARIIDEHAEGVLPGTSTAIAAAAAEAGREPPAG